jgi:hypothetical protein
MDVWIHVFLTAALVGEWAASYPGRYTSGERVPRYPLDPRTGLDAVEKRKIMPLSEFELRSLGHPADQRVAGRGR